MENHRTKKALAYNEKRRRENEGYRTIVDRELLLLLCFCVLAPISGERETLVNSYLSGIVFQVIFGCYDVKD